VKSWSKWIVGCDFGFDHPFAAVLCAWCAQTQEFWVIDSFQVRQQNARQHVDRIASMCKFKRVPIGYPHDGHATEKGSGQSTAYFYRQAGAPMLATHAVNKDGKFFVEPAIAEMVALMERGTFFIAPHNTELIEQVGSWHRNEKEQIVKHNDDLAQALRIAWMCRDRGKTLEQIDSYPGGPVGSYDFRPRGGSSGGGSGNGGMARGIEFPLFDD
jgi:Terminase RNaseH-like domain